MVDWQLTATTIYCKEIGKEVTILVHGDGKIACTGHDRHHAPANPESSSSGRSRRAETVTECPGLMCPDTTGYRDRLFAEEKGKSG